MQWAGALREWAGALMWLGIISADFALLTLPTNANLFNYPPLATNVYKFCKSGLWNI